MKLLKSLLAGLLVAGFAAAASAQTVVHVVGSTAYRAPFIQAVFDLFSGPLGANTAVSGSTGYTAVTWGQSTSSGVALKCNGCAISGTYNGTWYVVDAYWTGSAAGVTDLVLGNHLSAFLLWSDVSSVALTGTGYNLGASAPTADFDTSDPAPDIAMSDSNRSSVAKLFSDANTSGGLPAGTTIESDITSTTLVNAGSTTNGHAGKIGTVGIIPFEWVINNPGIVSGVANPAPATNITQQVAKELAVNGYASLSQLSGNSSDYTSYVFLVGRNEDSGTRLDSLAEAQDGFDVSPIQASITESTTKETGAYPVPTGGNGTGALYVGGNGAVAQGITQFPANYALNTEPNINWTPSGHSGYVTGGDVANVLLTTTTNVGGITLDPSYGVSSYNKLDLVGYLGISDATSALSGNSSGNAVALSYDGVPYSVQAVENGQYSVWGYEHEYYVSGNSKASFANAIADEIFSTDADIDNNENHAQADAAGIFYNSVSTYVTRSVSTEGGIITP